LRRKYLSGGKAEEGRAEQNSGPFEMVLNFKMRCEKKETFQRGWGGSYALTLMMVVVLVT